MLTKPSDKSPNKVGVHGRMNGISVYTPDESKWANYVPLRKNHSTSKADPASKPLFQNDIENEFKKALDSMKRQKTEKRTAVSSNRIPSAKSTKGAISRLRQENNEKLNESLERSFNIKNSNLQTTGRSSRSINCVGTSSVASNLSNTHDLDASVNKSLNGIDSPQLQSSKKFKSTAALQRDRSTSSIKDSGKKLSSKSPIQKSKSKLDPSPSPSAKSITSPKMLNFKTLNSIEKVKPETPSKSPTVKSNIKKINSATSLTQSSQTMLSKTKNTASQNKITPVKQRSAGDKLIGLLGPGSESKSKKLEQDLVSTSAKKSSYIEKNLKDLTVTDRLEKANADLKRKQEELALSYKKYALEKFVSKVDKYCSQLFIGGKREGFIQILSEVQRQNIKITQFLTWQEESMKRSYFDRILLYKVESKKRTAQISENVEKYNKEKYLVRFFKLWKKTLPAYAAQSESRMSSVRQNSMDSIWHHKKDSIDFGENSRRMSRINSSIDRLSLTKGGMIPTFSDSKIDKAIPISCSPSNKDLERIDQSAEIYNSQLDHSFGCETIPRESIKTEKENDTVLAGLSPSKDPLQDCDECIPDQIITHIPKPITKEAAPLGQWADKENKKSPFEKKTVKKTPTLKEATSRLNESNNVLRQSKNDLLNGNKLDKNQKTLNDKKPPTSKTASPNMHTRGSITEKENLLLLEKAKNHYNKRLMKIYGFPSLQRLWNKSKMQSLEANEFKKLNLIKKVFRILENGHIETNESICSVQTNDDIGDRHYKLMLKINAFNSFLKNFVQSFEEAEAYNKIREDFIKRKVFTKWFLHKEELKSDVDDSCDGYDCIIEKFRFIILAEKAFKGFKKHIEGEKSTKNKVNKPAFDTRKSPLSSAKITGRTIKI